MRSDVTQKRIDAVVCALGKKDWSKRDKDPAQVVELAVLLYQSVGYSDCCNIRRTGTVPRHLLIDAARALVFWSQRLHRCYERECNDGETENSAKVKGNCHRRILRLCDALGLPAPHFNGDPRGYPVQWDAGGPLPSNTMGGTYGIG